MFYALKLSSIHEQLPKKPLMIVSNSICQHWNLLYCNPWLYITMHLVETTNCPIIISLHNYSKCSKSCFIDLNIIYWQLFLIVLCSSILHLKKKD
jgi:hypothetical protein